MICTAKEIYKKVDQKSEYSLQDIQSVGDIVFQQLRHLLNNPKELAYEVPEIGTFNARFKKYENLFKVIQRDESETYDNIAYMISMMNEFREDKARIKEARHGKNKTEQSSEDQSEKH